MKAVLLRLSAALSIAAALGSCMYIGEENYQPRSEVTALYADRTILYHGGAGAAVYYGTAGEAFIWPAQSQSVYRGQWKFDETSESNRICTRWAPYKYNPITGVDQSRWDCVLVSEDEFYTTDEAAGDPLALTRRKSMPFALQPVAHGDELLALAKQLPALP